MSEPNLNAQAAFLTAVKLRSLDTAVEILKGIHDGKAAVRRVARSLDGADDDREAGGRRGLRATALLPKLDDLRRAGDLFFDVARLHVQTVDALLGMRQRHMSRLEERVGDLLGFPVRGNRGEVLDMTIPVAAVEADWAERPQDGARTEHCEIVRQFRVKNLTTKPWNLPPSGAVTPVDLDWSPADPVAPRALGVEVLRDVSSVAVGEVLPLRLRIYWKRDTLSQFNPNAEAKGRFVLRSNTGEVTKFIEVVLRFDFGGASR